MRVGLNALFGARNDGTGRYTRELLRGAARFSPDAAAWRLVTPDAGPAWSISPPVPADLTVRRVPVPSYVHGQNAIKLWFEQRGAPAALDDQVDLIHYPYFAAPFSSRQPVIVTIHDLIPLVLREYRASASVRAYMWLQSVTVRRARLILADSHASRDDIVARLRIPEQRVRVVHLGVDEVYRPRSREEIAVAREHLGLPERFILYAGGLDVRKNVERLILAYARVRAANRIVEPLAITGDPDRRGALYRPLRPLVERLGLRDHVRFLGIVPEELMPALIGAATLYVYPSRYEGFGLPVLEAMASGVPVACSNAGSLPEVSGDAAIVFSPDDEDALAAALARGLGDDPLRHDLIERGLRQSAQFSWERTAEMTLAAYRGALSLDAEAA
ncbi:MAG: glycosyltransferase family 1 protein [Chloroflexota bacterium]|nr:MAG: glycosyltransferase family 1 protein [Chloroflexota bacterium]